MTKGGVYDYEIELAEIQPLAKLVTNVPTNKLPELFDALLTPRELVDITRRLTIAQMLLQEKTYAEIYQATNASSNTIALVHHSLTDHENILQDSLQQSNPNSRHRLNYKEHSLSPAERYFSNRIKKGK